MIGIIGAMAIEVNGIIEKMEDARTEVISGRNFTSGKINGKECVVAECGIGKVNAAVTAQTMILRYSPDFIINTGIGGSTCKKTHVGYVVIANKTVQHDMDTTVIGDEAGTLFLPDENIVYLPCDRNLIQRLEKACDYIGNVNYITGTIATGDQFIAGKERRQSLNDNFGAVCCEMEGASIGQVCRINKVPFAILRSVSDSMASEEDDAVEYSTFSKFAAELSVSIILEFFNH